jgi:hypothetical protein
LLNTVLVQHHHNNVTLYIKCTVTDVFVGPSPSEMSRETAFRIFPIVHHYGMLMIECCEKAFERSQPDLWPSDPIASSEVLNHPGLVQCLALADAKQCDSLVQSCLSQLIKPDSVTHNVHGALASPHLEKLMNGLRSDTKDKIIPKEAGRAACRLQGMIGHRCRYTEVLNAEPVWSLFVYILLYSQLAITSPLSCRRQSQVWVRYCRL